MATFHQDNLKYNLRKALRILFNNVNDKMVSLNDISEKYLDLLLQDQRQPELVLSDLVKCRDVSLQVEEADNKLEFQEFPWIVIYIYK